MRTSVESFRVGLAAFIVPFMFFYSEGLLLRAAFPVIVQSAATALVGVYFLAAASTGYFLGALPLVARAALLSAAMLMISGGLITDVAGVVLGLAVWAWRRFGAAARSETSGPS